MTRGLVKLLDIYLHNTLGNKKELFKPLKPGEVSIYACGVTTYDHFHIGHALQAVYFDVMVRFLKYLGYKVTYVRNYTDVDDKIIARAQEQGISPAKLARDIIQSCEADMKALNCAPPDHSPKVSEMIPQIIAMVQRLIDNGAAYKTTEGDVYYRVRKKSDYGKLSNRKPDEMRSGTRELVLGQKEDELDFALWKCDTTPDASWPSPFGQGRPGWHIECSAMAKEFLGDSFDIHGGGRDLIFPHHENEIAQSESANKKSFANYWLHSGLLTINKQKMSKSLGNHINLKDFLKSWPAESLRLAYLQYHYGSNIDFSDNTFLLAHKRLYYYYVTIAQLDELAKQAKTNTPVPEEYEPEKMRSSFCKAMADDFNSAAALAELNKYFKTANDLIKGKKAETTYAIAKAWAKMFRELFGVFGILQEDAANYPQHLKVSVLPKLGITAQEIENLLKQRQEARARKDYASGDQIRNQLSTKGIDVMDTPAGSQWMLKYEG